jgi:hypothetical protein
MKCIKATFKIIKKLFVFIPSTKHSCRGGGHKTNRIKAKIIAFSAIVIPCLLQFPLVAFGQGNPSGINGTFVSFECARKSIHCESVVADGGNFGSKSRFVRDDSGANNIPSTAPQSKLMSNKNACKPADDGNYCGDYWDWYIYGVLPFLIWLPILTMPMFEKHNVKLRGARSASRLNDELGLKARLNAPCFKLNSKQP